MRAAIKTFQKAGGTIVQQQPGWAWHDPDSGMETAAESLLAEIAPALRQAPVHVTGSEKMHAVPFVRHDAGRLSIAMVNDFSWVFTGHRQTRSGKPIPGVEKQINHPSPPPCRNVTIHLTDTRTIGNVMDVVTGERLETSETGNGFQINVPDFDCVSVVVIDFQE